MVEDLEKWQKAGKISAQALEYGKTLIKNGAVIREVCDKIDKKIIELGAKPAWPTQVALDHYAAHYTPDFDDDSVFENNLVCLDVGAHVDGCIGDNACTVDLSGKWSELMKAAKEALEAARKALGVGVEVREIGKAIQEVIQGYGFSPVRNLSGHGLNPWIIHDVPTVPNFDNGDTTKLEEDQIVAIEPFATNGAGMIYELEKGNIFSLYERKPVRSPYARELLAFIEEEYEVLPFTTRWLVEKFGKGKTTFGLREMKQQGLLHSYPPLVEKGKGMVAVFEDSFLIGKEKVELLTKAD